MHQDIWIHLSLDCLFSNLFRLTSKNKHQSMHHWPFVRRIHWSLALCEENPLVSTQRASKAESISLSWHHHGPLARYVKLRVTHAPGMPGAFSPPPRVSNPDMHHDTCVTHVPWCMPGSLTSGFLWSWWRGKTFPAFPPHAQSAILRIW